MQKDKIKLNKSVIQKINKQVTEGIQKYKQTINYMAGDAPINILCLPKAIETILLKQGILRVYDLLNRDLAKIKGLGKVRVDRLTSSLNEFFPMG